MSSFHDLARRTRTLPYFNQRMVGGASRILIEFPASAKHKSHCQTLSRLTKARETFTRVVRGSADILNEPLSWRSFKTRQSDRISDHVEKGA